MEHGPVHIVAQAVHVPINRIEARHPEVVIIDPEVGVPVHEVAGTEAQGADLEVLAAVIEVQVAVLHVVLAALEVRAVRHVRQVLDLQAPEVVEEDNKVGP